MTTLLVVPLFLPKVNADTMNEKEFAYFYPFHWVSQVIVYNVQELMTVFSWIH